MRHFTFSDRSPKRQRGVLRHAALSGASALALAVSAGAASADSLLIGAGGDGGLGVDPAAGSGGGGGIGGGGGGSKSGGGGGLTGGEGTTGLSTDSGAGGAGGAGASGGTGAGGVDGASGSMGGGGGARHFGDGGGGGAIGAGGGAGGTAHGYTGGTGGSNGGGGGGASNPAGSGQDGETGANGIVVDANGTTISTNAPGDGAGDGTTPTTMTITTSHSYDFVGVGGGGGGGGGWAVSDDGGNGTSGSLTLTGPGADLLVLRSMLVGGAGGGSGGSTSGGDGGDATFFVDDEAVLGVAETLLVGGSGGGGSLAGTGGAATMTVRGDSTVSIGEALIVGGNHGISFNGASGGNGGAGTFNLGDSVVNFIGAATLTINDTGTLNFGNATPDAEIAGALEGLTAVTNNGTINFNQNDQTLRFEHAISGTGSVNHNSSGTTTLTGSNTYTGGTTITAGMLIGDTASLRGDIANDAALVFDQDAAGTYSGDISGAGSVSKMGTGTLTLTGTSTYLGGTRVSDGTLRGTTTSLQGDIDSDAIVVFQQGPNGVYAGNMFGTGSLVSIGTGVLTLSGTNTFSGGTLIGAGTLELQGGAALADDGSVGLANDATARLLVTTSETIGALSGGGAAGGTVEIAAGQTLTTDDASSTTFAGAIEGDGALVKQGTGTLTLSGTNTYGGGTVVSAGTLAGDSGSLQGNIVNDSALVFDQATNGIYAGDISGLGTFAKMGAGALTLSGTSTYSGTTTISNGMLIVNGSIANSNVTIGAGATLGGSGAIGGVTVDSGATFAPGNSIGTMNVAGPWVLNSGGIYAVELNDGGNTPGTNNDLTVVAGTAVINGGAIIRVTPENGTDTGVTYADGTTYTILQATGGLTVNGAGPTITDSFAFLSFTGSYDASNYYLTSSLVGGSFCLPGQTRNQCATGGGAFSLGPGNTVYDRILNMTEAEAAAALNALSGEAHASAQSVLIQNARFVRDAALNRARVAAESQPVQGRHLWAHVFGAAGKIDGDGNAAGIDNNEFGFLGGTDGLVLDTWRIGLLAGYGRTDFDVGGRASSGDSDNGHLGLYGGTQWGAIGARFGLASTWHWVETERTSLGETLAGDYDARTIQAFAELGYRFSSRAGSFEPFANAAYVGHRADGFTESGGAAALIAAGSDSDTGFTTLGLRAATAFALGQGMISLHGSFGWRHAFGDIVPESVNAFQGGTAFTVFGTPIAKDTAIVEAGLELLVSPGATLGLGYTGDFADDARTQSGKARIGIEF